MEKDWLKQLKVRDNVWYGEINKKTKKSVTVTRIKEMCICLSNNDTVDTVDGENGHRTHRIFNKKITRR